MSHHSPQDYDKFPTTDSLYNNSNHLFHSQQPSTYSTKRDKLQQFVYKWRWPIFLFILVLFSGILMWIYRREFFEALEVLSHKLKEMGFGYNKQDRKSIIVLMNWIVDMSWYLCLYSQVHSHLSLATAPIKRYPAILLASQPDSPFLIWVDYSVPQSVFGCQGHVLNSEWLDCYPAIQI